MKQINVTKLDAAERIPAVFGAFDGLKVGESMEVASDHDMSGLVNLFKRERPFVYDWKFLEQGPQKWLAAVTKTDEMESEEEDGGCCGCCGGH